MSNRYQQAALFAIHSVGGAVFYEPDVPTAYVSKQLMRQMKGRTSPPVVRRVVLGYLDKSIREVLQCLPSLPTVQVLDLPGSDLTDDDLQHVGGMVGLEELNISDTPIAGFGIIHLRALNRLRALSVYNTQLADEGLENIARLTTLEELNLGKTNVTDSGLQRLTRLPRLAGLDLSETQVTDSGVIQLADLEALRELYVHGTRVTVTGINRMKHDLPHCEVITVSSAEYWLTRLRTEKGIDK